MRSPGYAVPEGLAVDGVDAEHEGDAAAGAAGRLSGAQPGTETVESIVVTAPNARGSACVSDDAFVMAGECVSGTFQIQIIDPTNSAEIARQTVYGNRTSTHY
jgi:hypothetical protein